jgi:hypothetical protein
MKQITAAVLTAATLMTTQAFAGNGDLLVDGNIGIGTATPGSRITLGDYISTGIFNSLNASKIQVNDSPTKISSGAQSSLYLVSQPNLVSDSSSATYGAVFAISLPETAFNSTFTAAVRGDAHMYGSGRLTSQFGVTASTINQSSGSITRQAGFHGFASNATNGVVTSQYGASFNAINTTTGTITNQYGIFSRSQNSGVGTVGTAYGAYIDSYNYSTGIITTAYGLAVGDSTRPAIYNPSGTVATGYGLYVGNVQATNKWSLYSADATAPSYFAGNVGIGTNAPAYTLDVQGTIASNNSPVLTSDARYKKNLLAIDSPLNKVMGLTGLSYEWKTDDYKEKGFQTGRHYGVIAQEIEKVLPEVVNTAPDGSKAVAYTEIIPLLIEAIKEQQKRIEALEKRLTEAR